MKGKKLEEYLVDEIIKNYKSGCLAKELADEYGIHEGTIFHYLRKRGITPNKLEKLGILEEDIIQDYLNGMNFVQLGDKYHIAKSAAGKIINRIDQNKLHKLRDNEIEEIVSFFAQSTDLALFFGKSKIQKSKIIYFLENSHHVVCKNKKICNRCMSFNNLDKFYPIKRGDITYYSCSICSTRDAKNRALLKATELMEYRKKYYIKNKDKIRHNAKINPKKSEYARKYYADNKNNPAFRILKLLRTRLHLVLNGKAKVGHTKELLGCSIEEFKVYLESKFQKGMTWENRGADGWHIDHIKPCCAFDLTNSEEQRRCFHYTNLQPLCAFDNLSKGGRYEGD